MKEIQRGKSILFQSAEVRVSKGIELACGSS